MQLHILNNPKDAALAADAEFLKQSLFNLLHEEASPLVVETVKLLSTSDDSAALIEKVLPQLDEQQTHDLTLACGLFAQILNIAEDVHHERRRQIHEDAGHSAAEGSLTETVRKLKAGKVNGKALQQQLDNTVVTAVLTAHPTEVQRQTVLSFNRRIRALLPQRERCTNPDALAQLRREIDTVLLGLWQTSETRRHKLSVNDEINNGVSIFPMSFFEALPKLYRTMERDFQTAYPGVRVPNILKIGGRAGGGPRLDYGKDYYAAVTWDNVPNGKRYQVGWMSNWAYVRDLPTTTWRPPPPPARPGSFFSPSRPTGRHVGGCLGTSIARAMGWVQAGSRVVFVTYPVPGHPPGGLTDPPPVARTHGWSRSRTWAGAHPWALALRTWVLVRRACVAYVRETTSPHRSVGLSCFWVLRAYAYRTAPLQVDSLCQVRKKS